MKPIKPLIAIAAFALCASCTNNNQDTGGMDSASVSTNPAMQGLSDTTANTDTSSSDSTDIRFPMSDSSDKGGSATGQGDDSSRH